MKKGAMCGLAWLGVGRGSGLGIGMRWAWNGAKCGLACATIAKDMLNMVRI